MIAETSPLQSAAKLAAARRALTMLTGVAGVALLVALVIHTGPGRLAAQLRALGPLLPVLLLLTGLRYVLQAGGWRLAIRPPHRPGWSALVRAVIAGEAVGYATWGPIAREPVKALFLTPRVPARAALSAALAERAIFVFTAAMLALVAAGLLIARSRLFVSFAAATAALLIGLAIARRLRHGRQLARIDPAVSTTRLDIASDLWHRRPAALSGIATFAIAQEAINVLEVYLIFTWVGAGPTPTAAIVFAGLSGFLSAAGQFVPGGLGVYEASGALLADALSLGASSGVSLALARRARSLIWAAPGALLLVHRGYYQTVRRGAVAAQFAVIACLALAAPALGAEEALSLRVSPGVASAPAALFITVRVEPHENNRALLVEDDSESYYRSSDIQLEGDKAARTHVLVFRGLPAGEHRITAVVRDFKGVRASVSTTVMVTGSELSD